MPDIKFYTFTFIFTLMICLASAEERQCRRVKCLRFVDCNSTNPTFIPDLTNQQLKVLEDTFEQNEYIIRIIQSSGPIYEGDNISIPLIEFTPEQEKTFRGFFGQGFLRPMREVVPQILRNKREAERQPCCLPPTSEARVLITLNGEGELVQVVQLSDIGQFSEDTSQCGSRTNTAAGCNSECLMTEILVPSIVVRRAPPYEFNETQVVVGTCTAQSIL